MSKPGVGRALIGGAAMVAIGWGIMKGEKRVDIALDSRTI